MNVTINAISDTGKDDDKLTIEPCSNKRQLLAATSMCTTHGKPDSNLACVCQESIPICVTTDMSSDKPKTSICNDILYEACINGCISSVVAIRCEGAESSRCLTMEGEIKKGLLSSI
ncbi:hypothetical protein INT45_000594 [Circinella minor]|uniref:Uncharacterized protein n=1 Tax=Circinella minor TaxID=1195481 RepID=A0A8H7SDR0_9FUNG|nr:hypothetical protein INT45_000594 [Circinella minor]